MHSHCNQFGNATALEKGSPLPKKIDHAERRSELARALWRVMTRQGLEAVSLRHVAAEAGVSMGMVQHYFADKGEMVLFALSSMTEQVSARMGTLLAAAPDTPQARIRAVLTAILPLDAERRLEAQVAVTFLAHAPVDPRIGEYLRDGYAQGHAYLAEQLTAAGVIDPGAAASELLALTDGLTIHTLADHHTPETAEAILDTHLTRLVGE
jgi:AcrR family transcriptional regulator